MGALMRFESNLRRAHGLGSAKSGIQHWIAQRLTAIALIPLGVWFVWTFILLLTAPFEEAHAWFSTPWTATLAIFFVLTLFYHGALGLQVVWEDYIPHELTKWCVIVATKFISLFLSLLAIVSIFKIFLN